MAKDDKVSSCLVILLSILATRSIIERMFSSSGCLSGILLSSNAAIFGILSAASNLANALKISLTLGVLACLFSVDLRSGYAPSTSVLLAQIAFFASTISESS